MKMRNILIISLILFASCSSKKSENQKTEPVDSSENPKIEAIVKENLSFVDDVIIDSESFNYSRINGKVFKKNSKIALWNNNEIPFKIHYHLVYKNQKAFIAEDNDSIYNFYELLENGEIVKKGNIKAEFLYVTYNNYYYAEDNILYDVNPENQESKQIYDFNSKITVKDGRKNEIAGINELSENYIQVELSRWNSGCYDYDAYVIDINNGELLYDNEFKTKEPNNTKFKTCFFLADEESSIFFAYFFSSKNYPDNYGYLFNENFQIIDTIPNKNDELPFQCAYCEYGTYIAGINVEDNKIRYYYLGVNYKNSNQKVEYFLPYYFNSTLDKILAKIYRNEKIEDIELDKLNKAELNITRNFIFAKHNYQFEKAYYQAYFSTFKFYSSEEYVGKRTKEVNNSLSETDLFNLDKVKKKIN